MQYDWRKGKEEEELHHMVSALRYGKDLGCQDSGGSRCLWDFSGLCRALYDADRQRYGDSIPYNVYCGAILWQTNPGRDCDVGDDPLADPLLPVPDPENGNLSDACGSYGMLRGLFCHGFPEAMVRAGSGSHHLTVAMPVIGRLAKRPAPAARTDDLLAGACRDGESADRNPGRAVLVLFILAGEQEMV